MKHYIKLLLSIIIGLFIGKITYRIFSENMIMIRL